MAIRYGIITALAAAVSLGSATSATGQTPAAGDFRRAADEIPVHPGYQSTLFWGSGLIDVPVAWMSPVDGDLSVHGSVHGVRTFNDFEASNNATFGAFASIAGMAEVGASIAGGSDLSLFGRVEVFPEDGVTGLPATSVGVRGVSLLGDDDRGRFGDPCECSMPVTFYGVVSDRLWLGSISTGWSVGWGSGLFRNVPDEENAELYNDGLDTGGFFGGVRFALPMRGTVEAVHGMAEWNGWDFNVGVGVDAFGLELGVYMTELESLGSDPLPDARYNIPRLSVNIGTRTNIFHRESGARGEHIQRLRTQVANLERDLEERDQDLQRLRGILSQGAMPAEALAELRELREALQERIAQQEQEIERLEAQLAALRGNGGAPSGG